MIIKVTFVSTVQIIQKIVKEDRLVSVFVSVCSSLCSISFGSDLFHSQVISLIYRLEYTLSHFCLLQFLRLILLPPDGSDLTFLAAPGLPDMPSETTTTLSLQSFLGVNLISVLVCQLTSLEIPYPTALCVC